MTKPFRRIAAAGALVFSTLLLSACMFTPGKFDATLTLSDGGEFAFVYEGEISLFNLMQMAGGDDEESEPPACFDDDTGESRDCSEEEIADAEAAQARDRAEKEQFSQMFEGMDFSDPETGEQLAAELRKQKGWERVEFREEGVLDVRYAASGNLSHPFLFPTIDGLPPFSQFVTIMPRADGKVQVEAPGFGGDSGQGMGSGMGFFAMMAGLKASESKEDGPEMIMPDGTFTIITNGEILTNNTSEGAETGPDGMKQLSWPVNAQSERAPVALIALD